MHLLHVAMIDNKR